MIAHMFRCPNEFTKQNRVDIIEALRKKGHRKIRRKILYVLEVISTTFRSTGEELNLSISHPDISLAVNKQAQLGWEYRTNKFFIIAANTGSSTLVDIMQ